MGGGISNAATGEFATVGGGDTNTASGAEATVGGGSPNTASGELATVRGGEENTASGEGATVPGGEGNKAVGAGSFAAGTSANANNPGSFVWSDGSNSVSDSAPHQFVALASGGFTFYTALNPALGLLAGATLASGSGSWASLSDRYAKANISPVADLSVLEKVAALPISTWNYKTEAPSIRHLGPMAQDFYAAFGLGEDNKHISTVDGAGVALAAIQALYKLSQQKDRKIDALTREVSELEAQVAHLEQR